MAEKLDLKDRKILYELDKNARIPSSTIAKKVGLTPEGVNYRIKRFEKEGIVTGYQTVINLSKLGIIQFKIVLSLHYISEKELEDIIIELKKKEYTKHIGTVFGNWDLIISMEAGDYSKVEEIKNEVLSMFGKSVREKAISILVNTNVFSRNYFMEVNTKVDSRKIMDNSERIKLDKLDMEILKIISVNSRKSLVDLADKLHSTVRIINYRIKQMEKKEIISGYRISIDYNKLGIKFYKCFLYLGSPDLRRINELKNYFVSHKNIIHDVKVLGNWDYEPEFEVFSEEEFEKILGEMKDKFSDIISRVDVVTIRKEYKFVYF
jgi:DNA-binding Lrp family transcriptional regulator